MTVRQFDGDDPGGLATGEQRLGHHFDGHRRGPLAHADEYGVMADDMDVTALERCRLMRLIAVAVVDA